ncbi:mechanosensitive ion channel [bacterium]|nr:mechanosensitive ion channel [bacterium]MBU1073629.1 mechanosensitive ion channel [bacterium]MBU1676068.1 mechanosensitive ion channel [bacterium]
MSDWLADLDSRIVTTALRLAVTLGVALVVRLAAFPLLVRLSRRSNTRLDDVIVARLRGPAILTIVLAGIAWSLLWLDGGSPLHLVSVGVLKTLGIVVWAVVLGGIGGMLLESASRRADGRGAIQTKTLPLFVMIWKVLVYGIACYFLLAAWHINVTTWLASAGVAGIAVGFAAKDTLANLFAGVFILADAPFKIGDYIVIDDTVRGQVTEIGLRSSRMLTRDDVEVTVPNAIIGNAKIINETGGPYQKMRVRVPVSVAYGSDVDRVRELLLQCAADVPHVVPDPQPRVRFRRLGNSGLELELMAWVAEPVYRGRVVDRITDRVYKSLVAAGVEIPYPKQDVYIKELPKT